MLGDTLTIGPRTAPRDAAGVSRPIVNWFNLRWEPTTQAEKGMWESVQRTVGELTKRSGRALKDMIPSGMLAPIEERPIKWIPDVFAWLLEECETLPEFRKVSKLMKRLMAAKAEKFSLDALEGLRVHYPGSWCVLVRSLSPGFTRPSWDGKVHPSLGPYSKLVPWMKDRIEEELDRKTSTTPTEKSLNKLDLKLREVEKAKRMGRYGLETSNDPTRHYPNRDQGKTLPPVTSSSHAFRAPAPPTASASSPQLNLPSSSAATLLAPQANPPPPALPRAALPPRVPVVASTTPPALDDFAVDAMPAPAGWGQAANRGGAARGAALRGGHGLRGVARGNGVQRGRGLGLRGLGTAPGAPRGRGGIRGGRILLGGLGGNRGGLAASVVGAGRARGGAQRGGSGGAPSS